MIYGETYVSSGLSAIIFTSMAVAVLIASVFFLNEKTKLMQVTGLAIAIAALTEIFLEETNINTESYWKSITAIISAVLIHAIIYTQYKKSSSTVSVITFNAPRIFPVPG